MKTKKQMNALLVTIYVGASLSAASSFAFVDNSNGRHWFPQLCSSNYRCTPTCAPEVQQGNMRAVDKALTALANDELKDAETFKATLKKAQSLPEEKRIAAYKNMVGIQNDKELVEFIGAREIDQKYITNLSVNANLKDGEARMVINTLTKSLLGQEK